MKATINQKKINEIKAKYPPDKKAEMSKKLQETVEAMNDVVNYIEHSGRIEATQHFYGDYLTLVTTQTRFILYMLAGAGKGAISAAKINLGLDL